MYRLETCYMFVRNACSEMFPVRRHLFLDSLGLGLAAISALDLLGTSSLLLWVTSDCALGLLDNTLSLGCDGGLLGGSSLFLCNTHWLARLHCCLLGSSLGTSVGSSTLLWGSGLGDSGEDSWLGVSGRRASSFTSHCDSCGMDCLDLGILDV